MSSGRDVCLDMDIIQSDFTSQMSVKSKLWHSPCQRQLSGMSGMRQRLGLTVNQHAQLTELSKCIRTQVCSDESVNQFDSDSLPESLQRYV